MSSKILVIGESCKDVFHLGEVKRLCPEAPVPVFNTVKTINNGGMAKNVEQNLISLGNNVSTITNSNWEEITKSRYVHQHSNYMFLRVDNKDKDYGTLDVSELERDDIAAFDAIVVSDYNKGYLSENTLKAISNMHDLVFLDTKKILGPWCENFSYIKINNKEYNLTKHTISKKMKEILIVTCGPRGCEHRGESFAVPKVEIKDTSGAGDTFLAGLVSKYCGTFDIGESIRFANECATRVVQRKGVSIV
tara:strand:+ start:3109 stop:3855 length:747 start_codon:yes stop_codon:yes gene_type:complete